VGQRSKSANSDGRRNLMNSSALEPLNGFRPKRTQILVTVRLRFQGHEFKGQGHRQRVKMRFYGGSITMDSTVRVDFYLVLS